MFVYAFAIRNYNEQPKLVTTRTSCIPRCHLRIHVQHMDICKAGCIDLTGTVCAMPETDTRWIDVLNLAPFRAHAFDACQVEGITK